MDQIFLSYVAGFVDGEGSICIARDKLKPPRNPSYWLRCQVYNTNKSVIEYIRDGFGFGSIDPGKMGPNSNALVYRLNFSGNECLKMLELILPYMRVKKEEASIGIRFQKEKKEPHCRWKGHSPEELAKREWFYNELINVRRRKYNQEEIPNTIGGE